MQLILTMTPAEALALIEQLQSAVKATAPKPYDGWHPVLGADIKPHQRIMTDPQDMIEYAANHDARWLNSPQFRFLRIIPTEWYYTKEGR